MTEQSLSCIDMMLRKLHNKNEKLETFSDLVLLDLWIAVKGDEQVFFPSWGALFHGVLFIIENEALISKEHLIKVQPERFIHVFCILDQSLAGVNYFLRIIFGH